LFGDELGLPDRMSSTSSTVGDVDAEAGTTVTSAASMAAAAPATTRRYRGVGLAKMCSFRICLLVKSISNLSG
jgi:hypothetical protein